MYSICSDCIEDSNLKRLVEFGKEPAQCAICENQDAEVATSETIGRLLEPLLRSRIEIGQDVRVFSGPDDDKGGWDQEGDPLEYFVAVALIQDLGEDFIKEIVDSVIDADQQFFCDSTSYVQQYPSPRALLEEWFEVEKELRYSQRFFNEGAKTLFGSLFSDLERLVCRGDTPGSKEPVIKKLQANTELFRARSCRTKGAEKKFKCDPFKEIGPTPPGRARAGRMNADGVSVLYTALDSKTCLAEMRPAIGGKTALISLKTTKELTLLDFTRLESAYSEEMMSYFHPKYDSKLELHAFLQQLHELISQPVLSDQEHEYLITQTMAEYLVYVNSPKIDGILFNSAQREGGKNLAIFSRAKATEFPVSYTDESLKFYETKSIKYRHVVSSNWLEPEINFEF